ncbi:MAG: DUF3737 family protein [Lachnospiraceae bacterium]|nr:DUF3737 family protein [Lachnospiraceae bacterium]
MEELKQRFFTGERALFHSKGLKIEDSIFDKGESPLKESSDLTISTTSFRWKYPLWYCRNVKVDHSTWMTMARAGVWYTDHIEVSDSLVAAPKNFRRCNDVTLRNVKFPKAEETLWHCTDVKLDGVFVQGDYFGMNSGKIIADDLTLYGNYSFDGACDLEVRNSHLVTKDAFWNGENITVRNSYICGEYLGWNSKNLTLIDCTIESLQGLCYIDNIVMKNCKLLNTTLAFEYSNGIDASITNRIDSVFNPSSGIIRAASIGDLTIQKDLTDPSKTVIECSNIEKISDEPTF